MQLRCAKPRVCVRASRPFSIVGSSGWLIHLLEPFFLLGVVSPLEVLLVCILVGRQHLEVLAQLGGARKIGRLVALLARGESFREHAEHYLRMLHEVLVQVGGA